MNNSVSIAAIICNYNGDAYLREAINSVLAQEHLPDEFIIVDDKSTDNSVDIIKEAQNEYPGFITLIQHYENKGQAAGMNTACQSSHSDILAFLDSDDIWFPNKLNAVCEVYRDQPDFGLFQHNLQIIVKTEITDELYTSNMTIGDAFDLWSRNNIMPSFIPTSGLAIRRKSYNILGPLPEVLTISADSYMTRSAICLGPLVSTLEAFGAYRRHNSNNVYGNRKHNRLKFFMKYVSPRLADFYKSQGLAFPSYIGYRQNIFINMFMDVNIRKMLRLFRYFIDRC